MKIRHLTIFVTLLLFILLGTVLWKMPQFAATSRSNEPIPYIYYYSDLQNAWVIERADGTDSRLLGQGVMPEEHNVIDSVHWSPSGEWLAWRSHRHNGPGAYYIIGWLVSSDGRQVSHLFDDAQDIFLMEWSPNQDWLVVGFQGTYNETSQTIRIIDVPNQKIVAEFVQNGNQFIDSLGWREMPRAWSEDGQAVYFVYSRFLGTTVTRLEIDGHSETWVFDTNERFLSFGRGRLMQHRWQNRESELWEDWYITDLDTGEEYIFASFLNDEAPQNSDYDLTWNEQRTYAIVTENHCYFDDYNAYRCIPSKRYILDWENRSHYPIADSYEFPRNDYYSYPRPAIWSPSGRFLVLQDTTDLYLLDTNTQEIFGIGQSNQESWLWIGDEMMLVEENSILRFNTENREYTEFPYQHPSNSMGLEISPNGRMIGHYSRDVLVENIVTGESYSFPRSSVTTGAGPVFGYQWGSNPEWFFSGGNTQIVDSCCNNQAIMIHNLHERTGRELTICYGVDTCAGFLPDTALPHLARGRVESYIPAPRQILLHDRTVRGLAWSPDGRILATNSSDYELGGIINFWLVQAETNELEASFNTDLDCRQTRTICSISWLDEEKIILSGENTVEEINFHTGERRQEAGQNLYEGRLLSPNQRYEIILSGENGHELAHLQDNETKTLISETPLEGVGRFRFMHFDYLPEAGLLVGSSVHYRGGLWDVATGEQIATLNWTGYAAVFSPDGRQLAVASSEFVTIWDMSEYIENR